MIEETDDQVYIRHLQASLIQMITMLKRHTKEVKWMGYEKAMIEKAESLLKGGK